MVTPVQPQRNGDGERKQTDHSGNDSGWTGGNDSGWTGGNDSGWTGGNDGAHIAVLALEPVEC